MLLVKFQELVDDVFIIQKIKAALDLKGCFTWRRLQVVVIVEIILTENVIHCSTTVTAEVFLPMHYIPIAARITAMITYFHNLLYTCGKGVKYMAHKR